MISLRRGALRLIVAPKCDGRGWVFALTSERGIVNTPGNGPFQSRDKALEAGVRAMVAA